MKYYPQNHSNFIPIILIAILALASIGCGEKQKTEKRFYLLCKDDIPWEEDPQRENPNDRVDLFTSYKQELDNLGHNYFIVGGENRIENSISKISSLITII